MNRYRAEIDGLRAIAVLLVLLFHLTLTPFGLGGYIGVDVFFVISGYLITAHLRNDLRENFRGIIEFYRRRVIRIFPALFAVYLACVVAEICFKFASQTVPFKNVLLSSIFFGSNFYLFATTGYFDFRARANPLIHTWSLSIEEQFYILLPFLLFAFRKKSSRVQLAWLSAMTVLSLVAAQIFVLQDARISFYLVPLRAWELLAGSLLSYGVPRLFEKRGWAAECVAALGLVAILYSACTLNARSDFPGFAALPAVLGTCALLVATEHDARWIRWLLSCAPMRFTGKISYSLYLWHWPLIVYARYFVPLETELEKLAFIAVSMVVATLSWLWIEQPIRRHSRGITARMALGVGAVAMLGTAMIAIALPSLNRAIWPGSKQGDQIIARMENYQAWKSWRIDRCFLAAEKIRAGFAPECLRTVAGRPNVLVIGDSHAAMLWWGLTHRFPNVNFLQATGGSCDPFNRYHARPCGILMDGVVDGFLASHHLDAIVLSVRWQSDDPARLRAMISRLSRGADRVYVFGPNRWFVLPFPEVAARVAYSGNDADFARYEQVENRLLDSQLDRAATAAGATYVSVYNLMCAHGCWVLGADGLPVTYDYEHLSSAGSDKLAQALPPDLFSTAAPTPSGATQAKRAAPPKYAPQPGVAER